MSFLKKLDYFDICVLKEKQLKTLPGGILTLIKSMVTFSLLGYIFLKYFFQNPSSSFSFENIDSKDQYKEADNLKKSNLRITVHSLEEKRKEAIDLVSSYFRVTYLKRTKDKKSLFVLPFSVSHDNKMEIDFIYNENNIGDVINNYPRLVFQSCKTIYNLIEKEGFELHDEKESLKQCNNDIENFYSKDIIKESFFFFIIETTNIYVKEDDSFDKRKSETSNTFKFIKKKGISYRLEPVKFGFLLDNKRFKTNSKYNFELSWKSPEHCILKSFDEDFSFNIIFDLSKLRMISVYKSSIKPFFDFLSFYGSFQRVFDFFYIIPFCWYGYYTYLYIIKIAKRKGIRPKAFEEKGFKWDKISYCEWLKIRLGCGSHSQKQKEFIEMKKEFNRFFESLYSRQKDTDNSIAENFEIVEEKKEEKRVEMELTS